MQRKVLRTLKAAVAFSMVFSLSVPAWAASDKQQVQQNLDALESQKDALESRLSALQANKADTESYIAQLDQELNSVYAQVSSLTQQLEQTQEELTSTQEQLETAKAKEDEQYEALKLRIRAMYAAGDTSMLSVFLQASDISSILNATEYISRLSDYDANLLESLNNTRQEIETLEAQLQEQETELTDLKAQEESKQTELEMVMEAKQAELGSINSDIGAAYDSIANTQEEIEENNQILAAIEYQEELDRQEALKKQQEAEAAAADSAQESESAATETENETKETQSSQSDSSTQETQSSQSETESTVSESQSTVTETESTVSETETAPETTAPETTAPETTAPETEPETTEPETTAPETEVSDNGSTAAEDTSSGSSAGTSTAGVATGSFIWPCAGGYISSHFGGRTAPTAGASTNHKGVDIAASSGTDIYAADGGTVVTVSYSTARGNYIVISHGNGMSTLYQHCSAIYASVGQQVSQGDVIAAVGSTGYSTGAHLHFEVWVNGVPVDPEDYI
ncbi:peptidoglycan DD-metalloendopeptidase family protein [Catenibacillus scindens]|uniref:murein hydrolase activator EnvC family protein n=1 Tax=Catenibacillus scindens TaxID=673271 RepID=UPI00320A9929